MASHPRIRPGQPRDSPLNPAREVYATDSWGSMIVIGLQHVLGDAEGVLLPGRAVFEWCCELQKKLRLVEQKINELWQCPTKVTATLYKSKCDWVVFP